MTTFTENGYAARRLLPCMHAKLNSGTRLQRFTTFLHHARTERRAHALYLNLSTKYKYAVKAVTY